MFKKYKSLKKRIYQLEMEGLSKNTFFQSPFKVKTPNYFISEKLGVAYLRVPKAGCSSIQALILATEKPELYEEIKDEIKEHVNFLHNTQGVFETSKKPPKSLIKFTFVRHPFNRLLSFYKNQINPSNVLTEEMKNRLQEQLGKYGFYIGMSFEDFVELLINDRDALNEHHVRPQVEFLFGDNGLNVDYLGKLENISRHQSILGRLIGKPDLKLMKLNSTGGSDWRSSGYFNQQIVSELEKVYKYDLILLGYDVSQM